MKALLGLLLIILAVQVVAQSPCNSPGPMPFEDHGKWGYVSADGIVVPPLFDLAGPFTNDGAVACIADQCGLLGKDGSFVSATWNRQSRPFPEIYSEGLAAAIKDGKWGYIDRVGNVVISFHFKYAGQFEQGMARVSVGDKFFFINDKGSRVTPEFDGAFDFHEDLAAVEVGKNVGYVRRDGTFALPPLYQSASGIDFSEGLAAIRVNGKVGFMDKVGSIVIQPKYDDVFAFSDGLAPVEVSGKWGYVNKAGDVVVPIQYHIAHMFSEGLASVEIGGKWGYIDTNGQFSIPATFDSAMPFCGGVAAVETFKKVGKSSSGADLYRGKHGMMNHAGNYVWRDREERTWPSPFRD